MDRWEGTQMDNAKGTTLKDKGFRFVYRGDGIYDWVHPLDVVDSDIDCTDMSDEEFEAFVGEH